MGGPLGELGVMIGDDGPKRVIVIRCTWRMEQLQDTWANKKKIKFRDI